MKALAFLIFDLDGTLIDSRLDITNAVNATLAHYDIPKLSEEVVAKHVGTGVRPLLAKTLKKYQITDEREVTHIFTKAYLNNCVEHTQVYPGVRETLEFYAAIPKVILTNKSNIFIDPILTKLEIKNYFIEAFGRESFSKMKPDPEPVLQICRKFSVAPELAMIVGDTEVDLLAGSLAGIQTCAVTYGFGGLPSLKAQQPNFMIAHFAELKSVLKIVASTKVPSY